MSKYTFTDYRFVVDEHSGCWIWMQWRDAKGYGHAKYQGRKQRAHRIFWKIAGGEIPEGMVLHHRCGNTSCVNPRHLEVVSNLANVRYGRRCRLTADDVRVIRSSSLSHAELGKRFDVTAENIYAVRKGITWRDV